MTKYIATVAIGIGSSVLLVNTAIAANKQQVVDLHNVKQYCASNSDKAKDSKYYMRMGSFSSEAYATRFKDHLSRKTNKKVCVGKSQEDSKVFYVFVGPINGVANLLQTASDFLGNTISSAAKVSQAIIEAPTKITPAKQQAVSRHAYNKSQNSTPTKKQYTKRHLSDVKMGGVDAPVFGTGPYVGASGGIQNNISSSTSYIAVDGILSVGASTMFKKRVYLAGEFFGGDNIAARSVPGGTQNTYRLSQWFYGGDLIPGYMITDTVLGYIRVGVMRNQFKSPGVSTSTLKANTTWVRDGFRIGAGAQANLYGNLDGRVEYVANIFNTSVYSNNLAVNYNTSAKAYLSQANIGLVYKFTDVWAKNKFH